ncbi:MAG TPA: NnrU family protein [Gammaproteobacteria bacterium]
MGRQLAFIYGVLSYVLFFVVFLYAIGFVGDIVVPKTINSGADMTANWPIAVIINLLLLTVFALQHSIMARPGFKKWWTKFIPWSIERSTYVLLSSLALILIYYFWQPLQGVIWHVDNPAGANILTALFWLGWLIVLASTFMISHFELFGLKQVYMNLKQKQLLPPEFKMPMLYKFVRHPIMLGFIIAFWATPHMTAGHLLFAAVTTAYILVALQFEERDLMKVFGERYREYRKKVPMVFPFTKFK